MPPGETPCWIDIDIIESFEIFHSIEMEYEYENIVRKYHVDCHKVCPHSQQKLQVSHIRRTFVTGADMRRSVGNYTLLDTLGRSSDPTTSIGSH